MTRDPRLMPAMAFTLAATAGSSTPGAFSPVAATGRMKHWLPDWRRMR